MSVLTGDPQAGSEQASQAGLSAAGAEFSQCLGARARSPDTSKAHVECAPRWSDSPPAAETTSSSFPEIHCFGFTSKLGSTDHDPGMIKFPVKTNDQWSVWARTHPLATGFTTEFENKTGDSKELVCEGGAWWVVPAVLGMVGWRRASQ